jgi:hypothetical protein
LTFKDWVQDNFVKELEIIIMPATKKILIWGFVACGLITAMCIYIDSDKMHQSNFFFWLPVKAYSLWIFSLVITFIVENHLKKQLNVYSFVVLKICENMLIFFNKVKEKQDPEKKDFNDKMDKYEEYFNKQFVWLKYLRNKYKDYIIDDFPTQKAPQCPELPLREEEIKNAKIELNKIEKEIAEEKKAQKRKARSEGRST